MQLSISCCHASLTWEQQLSSAAAAHPLADKGSSEYEGNVCAVAFHEQLHMKGLSSVSTAHCLTIRKQQDSTRNKTVIESLCEGNHVGGCLMQCASDRSRCNPSGPACWRSFHVRLGGHAACRCQARCPSCYCLDLTAKGLSQWRSLGQLLKWQAFC